MRKPFAIVLLLVAPCLAGCSMYDALFGVFGNYYSGGGTTWDEKKLDYDQQVERWQHYDGASVN